MSRYIPALLLGGALAGIATLAIPVLAHNSLSVPPPTGIVNNGLSASDGTVEVTSDLNMATGNSLFDSSGVLCLGGDGTACTAPIGGMGANDATIDGKLYVVSTLYPFNVTYQYASTQTLNDNNSNAYSFDAAGEVSLWRIVTTDNAEEVRIASTTGWRHAQSGGNDITGIVTMDVSDCGQQFSVTAAADGDKIVLPDADAVLGCEITLSYVGADAGAQMLISPLDSDADGIEGKCYDRVGATDVYFNGTADADIALTKTTSLTGDMITFWACGAAMWCVKECSGIWTNP